MQDLSSEESTTRWIKYKISIHKQNSHITYIKVDLAAFNNILYALFIVLLIGHLLNDLVLTKIVFAKTMYRILLLLFNSEIGAR